MEIQIANTIRTLRREKGISQEVLAEAMEVSVQAVSKWENAQSVPEVAMLARLADYFKVTLDQLFYGMKEEKNRRRRFSGYGDC